MSSMKSPLLVLSDSFKGTLSSKEILRLFEEVLTPYPVSGFPMSDGGEGTLDSYEALYPGAFRETVLLPEGKGKLLHAGRKIFLESAQAVGYTSRKGRDPFRESSSPFGLLLKKAIEEHPEEILVGVGGTRSNDGGAGVLAENGFRFERGGKSFIPVGATLNEIESVSPSSPSSVPLVLLSDVLNPLLGPHGATYTFALQKGAKEEELPRMERNMEYYSRKVESSLSRKEGSLSSEEGAGAGGGIGFSLLALGARKELGSRRLLAEARIQKSVEEASLLVTGEGRLDKTSFNGKVVSGVLEEARRHHKKVLLVCGSVSKEGREELRRHPEVIQVFSLVKEGEAPSPENLSPEGARRNLLLLLQNAVKTVLTTL